MVGVIAPIYSGAAAGVVAVADQLLNGHGQASFKFESDGDISRELSVGGGFSDFADWIAPKPPGAGYQIRATLVAWSGALPGGTFGAWLSMAGNNEWGQGASGFTAGCLITIEIRLGTGPVLDAATYELQVADGAEPPP